MSMTDPISDFLTRIRNGHKSHKKSVVVPASKVKKAILEVLEKEGYIRGFHTESVREGIEQLIVELKYAEGEPVIRRIERVSKPGRRIYTSYKEIPSYYNSLGMNILSTSQGVMSDYQARSLNLGGEILCRVF